MFENMDFINFWDDRYAENDYLEETPSDELIMKIEEELGYKLPASYIWLMKQHNGGVPFKTAYPMIESTTSWSDDHVVITGIMGIGYKKIFSLCGKRGSQFWIDEWEYPPIGVALCNCPSAGHDMIFLDYRECGPKGEPKVVYIDQEYDYAITPLAESFEEFICGLMDAELFED